MNRMGIVVLGTVFAASFCYGQGSTSAAAPAAVSHGVLFTKVDKTLDSSKLKEGDAIEVEMASAIKLQDGTLVPKGSKLTGHVTAAKARSKGDPDSQLTLTFDRLNITSGKQLSIKGKVQAVFPPKEQAEPQMAGKASGAGGGGYGSNATVGTVTDDKSGSNLESSIKPEPTADPKSVGVQGIDNLQLDNGVLTSKGKNVKLGDGVRMIVRADILG
jgi:hypothetical protein